MSPGLFVLCFAAFPTAFFQVLWPASELAPVRAENVILGEAADQGLKGMIAVGEVIRRRESFKGFSVADNDLDAFRKAQPDKVVAQAVLAWRLSRVTNFTKGADHFDNVDRFGEPAWAKHMKKTAEIGDMVYYRS